MSDLVDFIVWIEKKKETLPPQFILRLMNETTLFLNEPAPDREIVESRIVSVESKNLVIILAVVKKDKKS